MPGSGDEESEVPGLYPEVEPHEDGVLDVGEGNQVYGRLSGILRVRPPWCCTVDPAPAAVRGGPSVEVQLFSVARSADTRTRWRPGDAIVGQIRVVAEYRHGKRVT